MIGRLVMHRFVRQLKTKKWSMACRSSVLALGLLTVPSAAYASGGGPATINHLFWYAINFFLYASFLTWVGKEPFLKFWDKRRIDIEAAVTKGARELAEANELLQKSKEQLQSLSPEALQNMVGEIRQDGKREGELLIATAREQAERVARQAQDSVTAESQKAEKAIRKEIAAQVIREARATLQSLNTSASDKPRRFAALDRTKELLSH